MKKESRSPLPRRNKQAICLSQKEGPQAIETECKKKLLNIKRPEEVGRTDDQNSCPYYRIISHSTKAEKP